MIFITLGQILATVSKYFFLSLSHIHAFKDSNYTYIRLLEVVPEVTDSVLISFLVIIFSLHVSFWIVSVAMASYTLIFLWVQIPVCYWSHPVYLSYLRYCRFLSLDNLVFVLALSSMFLLNFFNMSFSTNSNICVSSVLVSINLFSPHFQSDIQDSYNLVSLGISVFLSFVLGSSYYLEMVSSLQVLLLRSVRQDQSHV